jgi:hypothetical protein
MPGPGRLIARAAGIRTVSERANRAGAVRLLIRPTAETLRRLDETHTATVKVVVTYMPPGGDLSTLKRSIEMRKRAG